MLNNSKKDLKINEEIFLRKQSRYSVNFDTCLLLFSLWIYLCATYELFRFVSTFEAKNSYHKTNIKPNKKRKKVECVFFFDDNQCLQWIPMSHNKTVGDVKWYHFNLLLFVFNLNGNWIVHTYFG